MKKNDYSFFYTDELGAIRQEGDTCSKCGMKLELLKNADTTKAHAEHQH